MIYADDLTLTTMCNDVKDVESNLRIAKMPNAKFAKMLLHAGGQ